MDELDLAKQVGVCVVPRFLGTRTLALAVVVTLTVSLRSLQHLQGSYEQVQDNRAILASVKAQGNLIRSDIIKDHNIRQGLENDFVHLRNS